jgi:hypothetical protein
MIGSGALLISTVRLGVRSLYESRASWEANWVIV